MIRRGRPSDAEAIARLHQRAWLRAYSDFIPAEQILGWDIEDRVERWRGRLTDSPIATWVSEVESQVVGFVSFGGNEEDDLPASAGCLWALYVEPAAQGAGVGTELLAHAEAELAASGFSSVVLWVFTANEHGRRFYEARGWSLEHGSETDDPNWSAPALRYRKGLDS